MGAAASLRSSALGSTSRSALTIRRGTFSGRSDFLQQFRVPSNIERKAQSAGRHPAFPPPLAAPISTCHTLHYTPRPCRAVRSPPRVQSVHEGRSKASTRRSGQTCGGTDPRASCPSTPRGARARCSVSRLWSTCSPRGSPPPESWDIPGPAEAPHAPSDSLCSELPHRAPSSLRAFETLRAVRGSGPGSYPSWVGLPGRTVVYNRCVQEPVAHLWFLQEQMLSFRLTRLFRS